MSAFVTPDRERLIDGFGRRFEYLRLSVTDACNFRCVYCLPNGFRPTHGAPPPLAADEVEVLLRGCASLGVWKVRLTGGEPTVRTDIVDLVGRAAAVPGIRRVALSTNGYRLDTLADSLAAAGLRQLNVSVDHLDPVAFAHLTGKALLGRALAGIERSLAAGLSVKVNVVLMRGLNDGALDAFQGWVRDTPVTVRFIELMQTGGNRDFFDRHHAGLGPLAARLAEEGWAERPRLAGDGPAREYTHPDFAGGIGLIAPYAAGFCEGCNRLRVTSQGALRLCLFGRGETPLRPLLQPGAPPEALARHISAALSQKPAAHRLHVQDAGDTLQLAAVGG